MPNSELEIIKNQFEDYQKKFEMRLFNWRLHTESEKVLESDQVFKAELQLPSGRVLFSRFGKPQWVGDPVSYAERQWHDTENDEGGSLLIPDTGNVFEKLALRIVKD